MPLRIDEITDLPPHLRAQAERQLARCGNKRAGPAKPAAPALSGLDFDSQAERDFYFAEIYPKIQSGQVVACELHREFALLPAEVYCGLRLPAARYTPDFFLTYQNGHKEAIEVKHKKIRQLQRDYIYRRRLFIEIHARPNGWGFREVITE